MPSEAATLPGVPWANLLLPHEVPKKRRRLRQHLRIWNLERSLGMHTGGAEMPSWLSWFEAEELCW